MTTIADVATNFISQSKGVSPTLGLAAGYKTGKVLGQRNRELDIAEKSQEHKMKTDNAKLSKEQRIAMLDKVGGMAMFADTPEKWEALKKSDDFPEELNSAGFDQRNSVILLTKRGKDYLELGAKAGKEKWDKQQAAIKNKQKDRELGQKDRDFALKERETMKKAGMDTDAKAIKASERAFAQEDKLRDEFNKLSGDFIKIRDAYTRVQKSTDVPSAAGDLALIFNYMKILDPGSVVRESEFATAAASGSFGERLKAAGAKVLRGERLSAEMRADFVSRAGKLYSGQLESQKKLEGKYSDLSKRSNVNANNVVIDYRFVEPKEDAAPPESQSPSIESQGMGGIQFLGFE